MTSILRERNGGVEMPVLYSAAGHCISAAKAIVSFCDELFALGIGVDVRTTTQPVPPPVHPALETGLLLLAGWHRHVIADWFVNFLVTQGIYNHGFHLESASFVLALAALHPLPSLSAGCFDALNKARRLLSRLATHEPCKSVSRAVEQVVERIGAAVAGRGTEVAVGGMDMGVGVEGGGGEASRAVGVGAMGDVAAGEGDALADVMQQSVGLQGELSLDELWAMVDWNVGFSSMDNNGVAGFSGV